MMAFDDIVTFLFNDPFGMLFFWAQTMLLYVENPPESRIFSICECHVLVHNFFKNTSRFGES